MQVHYTHVRPPGDMSGVRLRLTDAPLPFSAGMMMYASYFQIPPRAPSHLIPVRCCYSGFEPARGFAYRVHTHELGRCAAALPPCRLRPKCSVMGCCPVDCSGTRLSAAAAEEHAASAPRGYHALCSCVPYPAQNCHQLRCASCRAG